MAGAACAKWAGLHQPEQLGRARTGLFATRFQALRPRRWETRRCLAASGLVLPVHQIDEPLGAFLDDAADALWRESLVRVVAVFRVPQHVHVEIVRVPAGLFLEIRRE